jgi:hypothetical protein
MDLDTTFKDERHGGWQGTFIDWKQHISNDKNSKEIDPQLDINSVSHILDCRFKGYKIQQF